MQRMTEKVIAELGRADWFSRVGVQESGVRTLRSWGEAIRSCDSGEWEDFCLEIQNQFCERLVAKSRARFDRWNQIVDEVKQYTMPLVSRKVEPVARANRLPGTLAGAVNWDILGACMECEFADLVPPTDQHRALAPAAESFYVGLARWYQLGHFPCGWDGEYPEGMLVVF